MIPPVFSSFYNNTYLKDVQAFYAKELPISSPDPITSPAILTPSPVLPTIITNLILDISFVLKKQLPPSSESVPHLLPQLHKMYLKHHEKQVEDILNYLDELHLHRIERMEEERTNGNELKTELKRIRTQIIKLQKKRLGQKDKIAFAHYRISDLEQIIEKIQAPLEAQTATMASAIIPTGNPIVLERRSLKRNLQRFLSLSTFLLKWLPEPVNFSYARNVIEILAKYYDPKIAGLDFEGMIEDIKEAPEGSFIPLYGRAYNLTGIDPTPEQWEKIADVIQEKNHIPFFDVAYQGFTSGSIDEDASSVRLYAARGMELSCAQSYSKNLGLYAERVGAINVICSSAEATVRYVSHSSLKQIGMFSFTGLNKAQGIHAPLISVFLF
ncbi:aspartate aminotransferase, chloroplastic [Tanacetum coccineum]